MKKAFTLIRLPAVKKRGFTLIELLIVIVLIAMMVIVAVPQFSKFGKRSDLSNKAEEFKLLFENSKKFATNPELNYNGIIVTLNYIQYTNSIANKANFDDTEKPWSGMSTSLWQEIYIPDDMYIKNTTGTEIKSEIYFVTPGHYIKENSILGVGFRICYEQSVCNNGNGDFVDVNLTPSDTSKTSDQNFKVIINESWR